MWKPPGADTSRAASDANSGNGVLRSTSTSSRCTSTCRKNRYGGTETIALEMGQTHPRFRPEAISFLRALKRNNDREWFRARKEQYECLLRGPMISLIEQLAEDFRLFAPDLLASPKASLYRIYRDTRFSENKAPLKTHVAAVFP